MQHIFAPKNIPLLMLAKNVSRNAIFFVQTEEGDFTMNSLNL